MVDETQSPPPPPLPPPRGPRDLPQLIVVLLILGALLVLSVMIFLPFVAPIVIALVVSTVAYPLFTRIHRLVGMARRGLASFLTCLLLVILVFLPIIWLGLSLLKQGPEALEEVKRGTQELESWVDGLSLVQNSPQMKSYWERVKPLLKWIREGKFPARPDPEAKETPARGGDEEGRNERPPEGEDGGVPREGGAAGGERSRDPPETTGKEPGGRDLRGAAAAAPEVSFAANVAEWLAGLATSIVSNAFEILVKFAIMLYILFFFFKDGPRIALSLKRAIPLEEVYEERIWRTFREVSRSIIRGSFGTAATQGFISGVAFAIVGIPAVFWGVATALASLIPPLGTALILVPASAYLLITGSIGKGIFIAVVAGVVGLLDNIIRPLLMRGGAMVHEIWLLLAILGGLNFFGPMGLIYGPMVLVFLGTLVRLFVEEERSGAPQAKA